MGGVYLFAYFQPTARDDVMCLVQTSDFTVDNVESVVITGVGYDDTMWYRCKRGYQLDGPARRRCNADNRWSPRQPPRCIGK